MFVCNLYQMIIMHNAKSSLLFDYMPFSGPKKSCFDAAQYYIALVLHGCFRVIKSILFRLD